MKKSTVAATVAAAVMRLIGGPYPRRHMEKCEVVVIGAGPAGLAMAGALRPQGIGGVVLERAAIGAWWRRHYDRLHLHTVRWLSHLPGYKLPRRYGNWVARDDLIEYMEDYVDVHNLDVRTNVEVERLQRQHPRWRGHTGDGDGGHAGRGGIAPGQSEHPRPP